MAAANMHADERLMDMAGPWSKLGLGRKQLQVCGRQYSRCC